MLWLMMTNDNDDDDDDDDDDSYYLTSLSFTCKDILGKLAI
jgi:hypothetical protein